MKQTQQITRSDLVAGCPLGADVASKTAVRWLMRRRAIGSARIRLPSMDIVAKQDTQDVLARNALSVHMSHGR